MMDNVNKWHKINTEIYNPYLSYEQNRKNGIDLPQEWKRVLVYDVDDCKVGYFVGRFYKKEPTNKLVCSTPWNWVYEDMSNLRWSEISLYNDE